MRARLLESAAGACLAVIAFLSLAGCGGGDGGDGTAVAVDLRDRTFVSTKDWSGEGSSFSTPVTVRFDADGLTWRAECNTAGADVEITADRLLVKEIASTEIGCAPRLHEQDEDLAAFFDADPSWELDGDRLTLSSESVEVALQAEGHP